MGQDVSFFNGGSSTSHRNRSPSREPLNRDTSGTGFSPRKGLRKKRPLQKSQLVKGSEVESNTRTSSVFTEHCVVDDPSTGKTEITSGPDLGWSTGEDFKSSPDLGWPTIEPGKEEDFQSIQRDRSKSFYEDEKLKSVMEGRTSPKPSSLKSWRWVRLRSRKQQEDKEKKNGLKPNELLALDKGLRDARAAAQNERPLDNNSDIDECDEDSQQRTVKILLCHGVFIVYDVSVTHTFERVVYWMNNVKKNAGPYVNICLVGNKADLSSVVDTEAAMKIAQEYRMEFFLVSAKSGENVYRAFMSIIEKCLKTSQFWGYSQQQPPNSDNQRMMTRPLQLEDGKGKRRDWKGACAIT